MAQGDAALSSPRIRVIREKGPGRYVLEGTAFLGCYQGIPDRRILVWSVNYKFTSAIMRGLAFVYNMM